MWMETYNGMKESYLRWWEDYANKSHWVKDGWSWMVLLIPFGLSRWTLCSMITRCLLFWTVIVFRYLLKLGLCLRCKTWLLLHLPLWVELVWYLWTWVIWDGNHLFKVGSLKSKINLFNSSLTKWYRNGSQDFSIKREQWKTNLKSTYLACK